jgi:hypothetical protein
VGDNKRNDAARTKLKKKSSDLASDTQKGVKP